MINLLVLDKDPYYGKCVEKTLIRIKAEDICYLGQINSISELEKIAERESLDILMINEEFYKYPHLIRNSCEHIIVTSMDINYHARLSDEIECSILSKPFVPGEFCSLIIAIADLIRKENSDSSNVSADKMEELIRYIKMHLDEDLSLDLLSSFAHYSTSYCSKCFKAYTGTNISDYIRDLRIKRAETLLKTTDYQVQEIADMVGISKINTFGTVFRSVHGISPSEYRSKYR